MSLLSIHLKKALLHFRPARRGSFTAIVAGSAVETIGVFVCADCLEVLDFYAVHPAETEGCGQGRLDLREDLLAIGAPDELVAEVGVVDNQPLDLGDLEGEPYEGAEDFPTLTGRCPVLLTLKRGQDELPGVLGLLPNDDSILFLGLSQYLIGAKQAVPVLLVIEVYPEATHGVHGEFLRQMV